MKDRSKFLRQHPKLREAAENEEQTFRVARDFAESTDYAHNERNLMRAQEWFEAMEQFLREYRRVEHETTGGVSDALGRMQGLANTLAKGKLPETIRLATLQLKEGNRWWPGEQDDIAAAVFYVEAAREGRIVDLSNNKTVREAYDVRAQTVRLWVRDRERICDGRKPAPVKQMAHEVAKRGERYRQWRSGRKSPRD